MVDHISFEKNSVTTSSQSPPDSTSMIDPNNMNYYSVLFLLLVSAMTVRQGTVLAESKQISDNASAQNQLNKANAAIHFSELPPNAKTATINQVQNVNEEYSAQRENIQNNLITLRQVAQVMMTQASTNVNLLQQDASEDSGWLQTLNTIFQVIDSMSPGK